MGWKGHELNHLLKQFWKKFSVWNWVARKVGERGNETIHSYDGDETSLIPYFSGQPVTKGNQWLS